MLGRMARTNEAIEELKKAMAIEPKSPALHADMAWFLEAKGDILAYVDADTRIPKGYFEKLVK